MRASTTTRLDAPSPEEILHPLPDRPVPRSTPRRRLLRLLSARRSSEVVQRETEEDEPERCEGFPGRGGDGHAEEEEGDEAELMRGTGEGGRGGVSGREIGPTGRERTNDDGCKKIGLVGSFEVGFLDAEDEEPEN